MPPTSAGGREDLQRYLAAQGALETSQSEVAELEHASEVEQFHQQMELLRRRLLAEPTAFRQMFISDGMAAVAWEFSQPELGKQFTETLWGLLGRGDDVSVLFMRFLWNLPLGKKRMFIRAIDAHLSDRYPMFDGLSDGWPAAVSIPPYIRDPEERSKDFGLVNQGYLGYMNLGYTRARRRPVHLARGAARQAVCREARASLASSWPSTRSPRAAARSRSTSRRCWS